eukprot:798829-Rhodomonas_salina.2
MARQFYPHDHKVEGRASNRRLGAKSMIVRIAWHVQEKSHPQILEESQADDSSRRAYVSPPSPPLQQGCATASLEV